MKAFIHLSEMNKGFFITILLLTGGVTCITCKTDPAGTTIPKEKRTNQSVSPVSYDDYKKAIKTQKLSFKNLTNNTGLTQQSIQDSITNFWVNTMGNDLFSYWSGTPWNFNGTTQKPKEGSIACGYLVTTLLAHMDVKLNRVKLAQYAAAQMMKALTPQQPIKQYNHLSFDGFVKTMNQLKKGVYIIGLDMHTGFIIHDGTAAYFLHSYYVENIGVIKEPVGSSNALKQSVTKWMITLTEDEQFIKRWVQN